LELVRLHHLPAFMLIFLHFNSGEDTENSFACQFGSDYIFRLFDGMGN